LVKKSHKTRKKSKELPEEAKIKIEEIIDSLYPEVEKNLAK